MMSGKYDLRWALLIAVLLPLAAVSCDVALAPEGDAPEGGTVKVRAVAVAAPQTRSSIDGESTVFHTYMVYVYKDSRLVTAAGSEGASVDIELLAGEVYDFYALANCSLDTLPEDEALLEDQRVRFADYSGIAEGFVPMVGVCRGVRAPLAGSSSVNLDMHRLLSRLTLTLDRRMVNCGFKPMGARIRQAALDVAPFAGASAATAVCDCDSLDAYDLALLDAGLPAEFYMLENCRGTVSGNSDPWKKTPALLGPDSWLCTYLELSGRWTTPGAGADIVYRLCLGGDSVADYNVERGVDSHITLALTDEGTLVDSWKVESSNMEDVRRLNFEYDTLDIVQQMPAVDVRVISSPEGVAYTVSGGAESLAFAGITSGQYDGGVRVMSSYSGLDVREAKLMLYTWDGLLCDSMLVRVIPPRFEDYDVLMPSYPYEWGTIVPRHPERGPLTADILSGSAEWVKPEGSDTVFFRYLAADSVSMRLQQAPYTVDREFGSLPLPRYGCKPVLQLSQTGDKYADASGFPYDEQVSLVLLGTGGDTLDFRRFATPDAVLETFGLEKDDSCRYADARAAYAAEPDFSKKYFGGRVITPLPGALASFQYYGLDCTEDEDLVINYSIRPGGSSLLGNGFTGKVRVRPAFPDQSYLGLCIYDGKNLRRDIAVRYGPLADILPPRTLAKCVWKTDEASYDSKDKPSPGMVRKLDRPSRARLFSVVGDTLVFAEPRDVGDPEYPEGVFPVNGAFLLSGEVANAHSGDTIRGYYTLDVAISFGVVGFMEEMMIPYHVFAAYITVDSDFNTFNNSSLWRSFFSVDATMSYNDRTDVKPEHANVVLTFPSGFEACEKYNDLMSAEKFEKTYLHPDNFFGFPSRTKVEYCRNAPSGFGTHTGGMEWVRGYHGYFVVKL